jgi:hypothetical protein
LIMGFTPLQSTASPLRLRMDAAAALERGEFRLRGRHSTLPAD